jgi:hypothetical protein
VWYRARERQAESHECHCHSRSGADAENAASTPQLWDEKGIVARKAAQEEAIEWGELFIHAEQQIFFTKARRIDRSPRGTQLCASGEGARRVTLPVTANSLVGDQ